MFIDNYLSSDCGNKLSFEAICDFISNTVLETLSKIVILSAIYIDTTPDQYISTALLELQVISP